MVVTTPGGEGVYGGVVRYGSRSSDWESCVRAGAISPQAVAGAWQ